jgi:hypothetical protein
VHAQRVLQKLFGAALSLLDARNARNLLTAVDACLAGRRLVMMELARHWPGAMRVAAPLKRLDRLLGNAQVHAVRHQIYHAAAALLVRTPNPVLIVDWSELKSDGRWQLLRAGLALRGRSLTRYEAVYPQRLLNSRKAHEAFLKRLKALLPVEVCPIVVTDAGFKVPWFRAVEQLGWHWLGRVRGQVGLRSLRRADGMFRPAQALYPIADAAPRALGCYALTEQHQLRCRIVLLRRPPKQRHQVLRRSAGRARGGKALEPAPCPDKGMARAAREPWLLAHSESLTNYSPAQIAHWYALRMQIESSFRDLKSHRFGCAFEDTLTRSAERLEVLLLIHLLATLAAWLAALAAIARHEYRFRISLLRHGWESLRSGERRIESPRHALSRLWRLAEQSAWAP